jgi:hypothetical protein
MGRIDQIRENLVDQFVEKEPRRQCGYRRIGGTYLMSGRFFGHPCGKMPFPLGRCPECGEGLFKVALRKPKFVNASVLIPFVDGMECNYKHCDSCPANNLEKLGKVILWGVGKDNYTPESFIAEANAQGISKRLDRIPKEFLDEDLEIDQFLVFAVHPEACTVEGNVEDFGHGKRDIDTMVDDLFEKGETKSVVKVPGVFMVFRPERLQHVVDEEYLVNNEKKVERLKNLGVEIIEVPQGGFDEEDDEMEDE